MGGASNAAIAQGSKANVRGSVANVKGSTRFLQRSGVKEGTVVVRDEEGADVTPVSLNATKHHGKHRDPGASSSEMSASGVAKVI